MGVRIIDNCDWQFPILPTVNITVAGVAATLAVAAPAGAFNNGTLGPQGVKPTAANTGPRIALTTFSGTYHTSADGESVSGLHITGDFYQDHQNVTLTDCQIDGAIYPSSNGADPVIPGLSVSYCTTPGVYATGCKTVSFDHCHIGGQTDDFMDLTRYINGAGHTLSADDITITNCLFDGLQPSPANAGKHLDAIQLLGANNFTMRNTVVNFLAPDANTLPQITSAFTMETSYNGPDSVGWILDGCWFYGGGYYQIEPWGSQGQITNCAFDSNGGTISVMKSTAPGYPFVQSGNTLDGVAVTLPQ